MRKLIFKLAGGIHSFLYRLTNGRIGSQIGDSKVLLLTTIGRKTGKERTTPLGYFNYDGGYVIAASNAGQAHNPGWYYNLRSQPQVTIQVEDEVTTAVAEIATDNLRDQLWQQLVKTAPSYADYAENTTRTIPLVILRPT